MLLGCIIRGYQITGSWSMIKISNSATALTCNEVIYLTKIYYTTIKH
jgi:hypothetical protein